MLTLKKSLFQFRLPRVGIKPMQLSPVVSDGDELLEEIDNAAALHDDNWQLEATPDTDQLEKNWQHIEDDIRHDPEWVWLSDDE